MDWKSAFEELLGLTLLALASITIFDFLSSAVLDVFGLPPLFPWG